MLFNLRLITALKTKKYICAICAAPSILGHKGLLKGRNAICFPGFEEDLCGAIISEKYDLELISFEV